MRSPDTAAAARALASVAPQAAVASLQNDVDNEELLAASFARVIGGCVRQTSTRTADHSATCLGSGRIVLGAWPSKDALRRRAAIDASAIEELAGALRRAGYDVGISTRILEDKWLKLCVNLMSAPNALIRREDHATRAFVELKARLLEEARAILRCRRDPHGLLRRTGSLARAGDRPPARVPRARNECAAAAHLQPGLGGAAPWRSRRGRPLPPPDARAGGCARNGRAMQRARARGARARGSRGARAGGPRGGRPSRVGRGERRIKVAASALRVARDPSSPIASGTRAPNNPAAFERRAARAREPGRLARGCGGLAR